MKTKLRDTTRKIISALEKKSGYPVQVIEDPDLSTIAVMRIARDNMPAHILKIKSVTPPPFDYTTCFQCSLVLRLFECAPENRFLIGSSPEGSDALDKILYAPKGLVNKFGLSQSQADTLRNQLLQGLITHLYSVAVGLRVTESLTIDYPELLDLEAQHVERELNINRETLSPSVREMIPQEVFNASQKINAAYAIHWAQRLEKPQGMNPYRLEGFETGGNELLKIFESIPNDPEHDYELVDGWANYLGLRGWYRWVKYEGTQ
jgi:hypothetical protein